MCQLLRLKVAQALVAFDASRSGMETKDYVFGCMRNRVKDLLKEQDRRNRRRGGGQLHVEDISERDSRFESRYFQVSDEQAFLAVEDEWMPLPATLTELERHVVYFLLLDLNQTEIARELGVSRERVRSAHRSVETKMEDWRPSQPAKPAPDRIAA